MSPIWAHPAQHLDVALRLEQVLQLEAVVEVVLDGALLAAGDDDHLLDARGHGLFHRYWMTGLSTAAASPWLRLVAGQEACPPTGSWEDGFADAHRTSS